MGQLIMGSTRQIRVERQYEIRLAVIIWGYRKQGCLPKARRKVIRDTHASEEVKAGFTDGLKFPLVTRQCRARLLRTHKWDLMRSLELPKMQCRQGYARTFHTIAIIQRHGVYVDEEESRERGQRGEKKKFDTYTRNLNFAFEVISRKETRVKKNYFSSALFGE